MPELLSVILLAWGAGLAAWIGGLGAHAETFPDSKLKQDILFGIVAFGGGILMAAVAFALLPQGKNHLSPVWVFSLFCLGGIGFCSLDVWMARRGGSKAQFTAMVVDFMPEAMAMGAVCGVEPRLAFLLAGFIAAQNLPEGFNAYREMREQGSSGRPILSLLLAATFLGPIAAALGYLFLEDAPIFTAGLMTIAGGGIVYLVFQDIAPKAGQQRAWTPTLGAVLGFGTGLLGSMLLHG
ncbi:MAG: ZIP family metal transporter [Opitutales bacterium]